MIELKKLLSVLLLLAFVLYGTAFGNEYRTVTLQDAAVATGNGTWLDVRGKTSVGLHVTIATTATVTFEGTIITPDGDISTATWYLVRCAGVADGAVVTTATASGAFQCNVTGYGFVRARVSAWTAGAVTVQGHATTGVFARSLGAGVGVTIGTLNTIPKFGAADLADSLLSDDGTDVTLASGQLLLPDGLVGTPALSFTNDPDSGIFNHGTANRFVVALGGSSQVGFGVGFLGLRNSSYYGLSASTDPGGTQDVRVFRDAAGILAQRNSTNAQTFRVYETWTDASNYEGLALDAGVTTADTVTLSAITAGAGTDNIDIVLTPAGTGGVGIGKTPTSILDVQKDQNAITIVGVVNAGTGTASRSSFVVGENLSSNNFLAQYFNNSWTTTGANRANAAQFVANANASGGLDLSAAHASGIITFHTGGVLDANRRATIDSVGNFGVGVAAFGTSATNVLGITADGTVPSSSPAGMIQIFADDSSDGAANATLAFRTEQAVEATATFTQSHRLQVWVNGVEYFLSLDDV